MKPTPAQIEAAANTDRELWREREGDFYADSIHVTKEGSIGMNCGGKVVVMPIRKWFDLTAAAEVGPTYDNSIVMGQSRAALAAAAEVGDWHQTAHDNAMQVLADRNAELMERIKELTAAAKVGMTTWDRGIENRAYPKYPKTAAAEIEVRHPKYAQDAYAQGYQDATDVLTKMTGAEAAIENVKAETIERCAQVVDKIAKSTSSEDRHALVKAIASAIRALKDKP